MTVSPFLQDQHINGEMLCTSPIFMEQGWTGLIDYGNVVRFFFDIVPFIVMSGTKDPCNYDVRNGIFEV